MSDAQRTCAWKQDSDDIWWTKCGHGFVFTDGGPKENKMKFCCYCGLAIKPAPGGDAPASPGVSARTGAGSMASNTPPERPAK